MLNVTQEQNKKDSIQLSQMTPRNGPGKNLQMAKYICNNSAEINANSPVIKQVFFYKKILTDVT